MEREAMEISGQLPAIHIASDADQQVEDLQYLDEEIRRQLAANTGTG